MHEASAAYISRMSYHVRYCSALRSQPPSLCVCMCVKRAHTIFYKSGAKLLKIFDICKFFSQICQHENLSLHCLEQGFEFADSKGVKTSVNKRF